MIRAHQALRRARDVQWKLSHVASEIDVVTPRVEAIEQGREREIMIARRGRPAAKLVPLENVRTGRRIGVAKGASQVPDAIDANSMEMVELFLGGGTS